MKLMKLTLKLIENLRRLLRGEAVPYSAFPPTFVDTLAEEGLLNIFHHGSRRLVRTHNPEALAGALPLYNEALRNLDEAAALLSGDSSRSAQASLSGNSKVRSERSCPGFLVNTYCRMECLLNGKPFILEPDEGSAVYIADWESFIPPSDALVAGVENMENFLKIRLQERLFSSCLRENERQILFVARYAFSSDLAQWLERIPNRYLHFGDFDLAGISIFLTQFKPSAGERGSFLIPADIEQRLSQGSRQRYDTQYDKYRQFTTPDPELNRLIAMIHHYRRCYDQEGYIEQSYS